MTFIMRVGSTSCVPSASVGSGRRAGWKPCIWACPSVGCSGAATSAWPSACAPPPSAFASPRSMAAFTSRSTMRPAGPEPSIFERSRSFSLASRRTIGDALNCPFPPAPLPEGASACALPSPDSSSISVAVARAPPPASLSPPASASAPPPASASPPRSGTSSPSPAIKAMAPPTGTSSPSEAMSWARVPESSASSSRVTLSVSISAMASPSETSSPSLLSHLRRVPSSIASPILGMITSGTLLLLHVQNPTGRVRYLLLAREGRQLQVPRVRRRHLRPADPFYGSVQIIERPILDDRRHLARDPEPTPLLLHRHRPVRLLDRLDEGVLIKGAYGAQVYDLRVHVILLG